VGKERRAVKLRKFLGRHSGEGFGFPMYAALQQPGDAGWMNRRSLNGTKFGNWFVVPTDYNDITIFDLVEIPREVGLGFLNVDSRHTLVLV
jgi:hypothetical protein